LSQIKLLNVIKNIKGNVLADFYVSGCNTLPAFSQIQCNSRMSIAGTNFEFITMVSNNDSKFITNQTLNNNYFALNDMTELKNRNNNFTPCSKENNFKNENKTIPQIMQSSNVVLHRNEKSISYEFTKRYEELEIVQFRKETQQQHIESQNSSVDKNIQNKPMNGMMKRPKGITDIAELQGSTNANTVALADTVMSIIEEKYRILAKKKGLVK
jgi:hypothetical protein